MRPLAGLSAYAAGLVLVFIAALGVGHLVGPVGSVALTSHAVPHAPAAPLPGGLAIAQDGYRLQLAPTLASHVLGFTVLGPDGHPLRAYERVHDRELHLIVVRRDLTGFQHLHPTRDDAGRWATPLRLTAPGSYKVLADFTPAGRTRPVVLGADLTAPGGVLASVLSGEVMPAGYQVSLEGGLRAGRTSDLRFTIRHRGQLVTDLDPYLGALGHLVVLREGDLAYLHVHPADALDFEADVPSAGGYRLFLQFQHHGVVRTAELPVVAR